MGSVFAGVDARTGRTVAVKLVMSAGAPGDQVLKRLQREIEILGRLAGLPGIVQILDCGAATLDPSLSPALRFEVPFFVMERLVGVSFRQLFRQEPWSLRRIGGLLAQVADIVHAAHQRGVLHRDLKPDNLFLVQQEGLEDVRVLDFGISKATFSEEDQTLTMTQQYLGTVQYSSPEQFANFRSVDARSDIYALGAILFLLLTGRHAVARGDSMAMCLDVVRGHVERHPARMRQDIPEWLDTLVAQCLALSPAQRPATAAEVARRLRQGLSAQSAEAALPQEGTLMVPIQPKVITKSPETLDLPTLQPPLEDHPSEALTLEGETGIVTANSVTTNTVTANTGTTNTVTRRGNPLEALTPTHRHKTGELCLEPTPPPRHTRVSPSAVTLTERSQAAPTLTAPIQAASAQSSSAPPGRGSQTLEGMDALPVTEAEIPHSLRLAAAPDVQSSSALDALRSDHEGASAPVPSLQQPRAFRKWGGLLALTGLLGLGAGLYVFGDSLPALLPSSRAGSGPVVQAERSEPDSAPTGKLGRPERIRLPALRFTLGSTRQQVQAAFTWCQALVEGCRAEIYERELPAHRVEVRSFWMAREEVRVSDYVAWLRTLPGLHVADDIVVSEAGQPLLRLTSGGPVRWRPGAGVEPVPGAEALPIAQVPWMAARLFCQAQAGELPTEAQWERAARGASGRSFPWGEALPSCETAVLWRGPGGACAAAVRPGPSKAVLEEGTVQVASFLAPVGSQVGDHTPEGVEGLGGNVSEWVLDGFVGAYPPCAGPCLDPQVAEGPMRVVRGGNATLPFESARAAGRSRAHQDVMADNIGLRCVWPDKG